MDVGECWGTVLNKYNAVDDKECLKFYEKHKTFGDKKIPVTDITTGIVPHTINWLKKSTLALSKTMAYHLHNYLHSVPTEDFLDYDCGKGEEHNFLKEIHWLDLNKRHFLSLSLWADPHSSTGAAPKIASLKKPKSTSNLKKLALTHSTLLSKKNKLKNKMVAIEENLKEVEVEMMAERTKLGMEESESEAEAEEEVFQEEAMKID